jgi:zinc transporter ZupT
MAIGSSLTRAFTPRQAETILPYMQNLSAGVLIAAIGNELFPLLKCGAPGAVLGPTPTGSYLGLICGFLGGLAFMFGLEHLTESITGGEDSDSDSDDEEDDESVSYQNSGYPKDFSHNDRKGLQDDVQKFVTASQRLKASLDDGNREVVDRSMHDLEYALDVSMLHLRKRQGTFSSDEKIILTLKAAELAELGQKIQETAENPSSQPADIAAAIKKLEDLVENIHSTSHGVKVRVPRWAPLLDFAEPAGNEPPWSQTAVVSIDAAVDGLLIGLTYSADTAAGLTMALATSIEMAFLGLQYSTKVRSTVQNALLQFALISLPPVILFFAGMLGAYAGSLLTANQSLFIGFIAFSLVALLFMITQELIVEAHEGSDSMLSNSMLFIGILGEMVLDKMLTHT